MQPKLSKQLALVTLGIAVGILSLTGFQSTTHADSINTISRAAYVKTTRPMFTGQYYWHNGKRGGKIITPKGTILLNDGVGSERLSNGSLKYTINLSRGDLHYNAEKNIDETGKPINLRTSDFKHYNVKMAVRTRVLQSGTGYTNDATNRCELLATKVTSF